MFFDHRGIPNSTGDRIIAENLTELFGAISGR